jgi:hypothetical protein
LEHLSLFDSTIISEVLLFELWALFLVDEHFPIWSTPPSFLCFCHVLSKLSLFDWPSLLPWSFFSVMVSTSMDYHKQLICWDGALAKFFACPDLNYDFPHIHHAYRSNYRHGPLFLSTSLPLRLTAFPYFGYHTFFKFINQLIKIWTWV